MHLRSSLALVGMAAVLVSILTGCSEAPNQVTVEKPRLEELARRYGRFTGQNRGQPPKDEAEFKDFVAKIGPVGASSASADELFVSERDGKPYVILYGAQAASASKLNGQPIMGYEQEGVSGRRYVANSLGQCEELDEAKFKELVP